MRSASKKPIKTLSQFLKYLSGYASIQPVSHAKYIARSNAGVVSNG